jgi:hypothetical protein
LSCSAAFPDAAPTQDKTYHERRSAPERDSAAPGTLVAVWAEKISRSLSIPEGFGEGDFPTRWSTPSAHAEPPPALKLALIDKTQSALHTIYAGVLIWVSRRLQDKTDTKGLEDLAVMLFCYQHDASYLRMPEKRPRILHASRAEKFEGTAIYLQYLAFYAFWLNEKNWPLLPHWSEVAGAITLARYHMGANQLALFDPWVQGIIARMNVLGPLPEHERLSPSVPKDKELEQRQRVMGSPIAPHLLDLRVNLSEVDSAAAAREFLTTVDWRNNQYLQPPENVILASGGSAYRDPRLMP